MGEKDTRVAAGEQAEVDYGIRTSVRLPPNSKGGYGFVNLPKTVTTDNPLFSPLKRREVEEFAALVKGGKGVFLHASQVSGKHGGGRLADGEIVVVTMIEKNEKGFSARAETEEWHQKRVLEKREELENRARERASKNEGEYFISLIQKTIDGEQGLRELGFSNLGVKIDSTDLYPNTNAEVAVKEYYALVREVYSDRESLGRAADINEEKLRKVVVEKAKLLREWYEAIEQIEEKVRIHDGELRPVGARLRIGCNLRDLPNEAFVVIEPLKYLDVKALYDQAVECDRERALLEVGSPEHPKENLPLLADSKKFVVEGEKGEVVLDGTNNRIVRRGQQLLVVGRFSQARLGFSGSFVGHKGMSEDSEEYYGASYSMEDGPLDPLKDVSIVTLAKGSDGRPRLRVAKNEALMEKKIEEATRYWKEISELITADKAKRERVMDQKQETEEKERKEKTVAAEELRRLILDNAEAVPLPKVAVDQESEYTKGDWLDFEVRFRGMATNSKWSSSWHECLLDFGGKTYDLQSFNVSSDYYWKQSVRKLAGENDVRVLVKEVKQRLRAKGGGSGVGDEA